MRYSFACSTTCLPIRTARTHPHAWTQMPPPGAAVPFVRDSSLGFESQLARRLAGGDCNRWCVEPVQCRQFDCHGCGFCNEIPNFQRSQPCNGDGTTNFKFCQSWCRAEKHHCGRCDCQLWCVDELRMSLKHARKYQACMHMAPQSHARSPLMPAHCPQPSPILALARFNACVCRICVTTRADTFTN